MFDDVELPDDFQYGSLFGFTFGNMIQEGRSGHEKRIAITSQSRHLFRLQKQLQSQAEAAAFKDFVLARRGSYAAFKLKDSLDYTSNTDGTTAPTAFDQSLGSGDGTTRTPFYLYKTYDQAGARPYLRRIGVPDTSSVTIAVNGVTLTPGTDFTVASNGAVTFATAPTAGAIITCGFTFKVPVRFTEAVDKWTQFASLSYATWNLSDLDCIEVLDETEWPDRFNPGGSRIWGTVSADVYLNFADGVLQAIKPTTAINAFLPNPTKAPSGWCLFTVWNDPTSGGNIQVRDDLGATVGAVVTPGSTKTYGLMRSSTTQRWIQT